MKNINFLNNNATVTIKPSSVLKSFIGYLMQKQNPDAPKYLANILLKIVM